MFLTVLSVNLLVVFYHVTIVASGHRLLEKIWAYGKMLHSTHCREFPLSQTMQAPTYFLLELPTYYLTLAMSSALLDRKTFYLRNMVKNAICVLR